MQGVRASVNAKLEMLHVLPPHAISAPESAVPTASPPTQSTSQPEVVATTQTTEVVPIASGPEVAQVEEEPPKSSTSSFQLPPSFSELIHTAATTIAGQAEQHAEPVLSSEETTCRSYLEKYAVIPGVSWGMLTTDMQKYAESISPLLNDSHQHHLTVVSYYDCCTGNGHS
jgi:hypothetical protein